MFGDAIKRLEYAIRQRPELLVDENGRVTEAFRTLSNTIRVMLYAIGEDELATALPVLRSRPDLFAWLREHGIGDTPYDKLIPWTYRVIRAWRDTRGVDEDLPGVLQRRAAAIMEWQAATRADINRLTAEQVIAAVDKWDAMAKPARNVGEVIYRFRDGWTVQRLDEPAALKEEGRRLHHCVGTYCKEVAAGRRVIFSLRDPANVPRITMDWDPKTKRFVEIHGDKNAAPTPDVQPYLVEVIQRVFGSELEGLRMTGVPLKKLNLRGVVWHKADLSGADLRGVDLSGADLSGADLSGADLSGAWLVNAVLIGAVLIGADLSGANLTGAIFDEKTIMPDGRRWSPRTSLGYHRRRRF